MWDGRLANLEEQALGPIQAAGEMNMPLDKLMARLASIAEYKPLFEASFPGVGMKPATLAQAIATYERTVVSDQAPFDALDRGQREGDFRRRQARLRALQHQGAVLGLPRGLEFHQ